MEKNIKKHQTSRARYLRKVLTPAERKLWGALRNRKLENCKFYRQYPHDNTIIDFYCRPLKLAIEIDGDIHKRHAKKDTQRDASLSKQGIHTLRFSNRQILYEFNDVISNIAEVIQERQKEN